MQEWQPYQLVKNLALQTEMIFALISVLNSFKWPISFKLVVAVQAWFKYDQGRNDDQNLDLFTEENVLLMCPSQCTEEEAILSTFQSTSSPCRN